MSKPKQSSAEGLRSWQEINQHVPDQALSPAARRNRLVRWAGWSATVFTVILLMILAIYAVRAGRAAPARGTAGTLAMPLGKFQFTTDGVLTQGWVMNFLHLNIGDPLEKIDLNALQQKLIATRQVSDAFIERIRPGTLHIVLKERHPVLRAAVDNGANGYKLFLVARDGTVFEGLDYPTEILNKVPWMNGWTLHHAKDGSSGFEPVPGMTVVADLLKTARERVPQLAAQWAVVDLSQFDPRPQASLSLIKIPKAGDLGQLTFVAGDYTKPYAVGDFTKQIDRLALAAHTVQEKQLLVSGYDMSIADQVIVRLLGGSSATRQIR